MSAYHLPAGLPAPQPMPDGLDLPHWDGLRQGSLVLQRCESCEQFQWGPEWICNHCLSFDMGWQAVAPKGIIYSWQRVWHPAHPALVNHGPYLVVIVELPDAGNVRVVGNLLGDPMQEVTIGGAVAGMFEHHHDVEPPFTLLQWRVTG